MSIKNKMRAVVYEEYGAPEMLHLKEVEKPVPEDDEVLIKVFATSVTIADVIVRKGKHPTSKLQTFGLHLAMGIRKPRVKILGIELAGVIEVIGKDVTQFKVGDEIIASPEFKFGGYAQYKCLPEDAVMDKKPNNISFEEAAGGYASGGVTAWRVLRKANIQNGQKVLVYGASGSVGTFGVQIAKTLGADVTGVCSTSNLDMVKSLGAKKVIDYTQDDITHLGEIYDVVFDAVDKFPPSEAKKTLKKSGKYLNVIKDSGSKLKKEDLQYILNLVKQGKIKAQIDRTYPLEQIVEAHKYVEKGHKKGNVVITIPH